MLPKHDSQIEAVCADGLGRVLLLQETPPRVELIDPEALKVITSIDRTVGARSGGFPTAKARQNLRPAVTNQYVIPRLAFA